MFALSSIFSGLALGSSSFTSTLLSPKPPNSRYAGQSEECNVCFLQPLYFPSFPPTEACDHPSQVCHSCLQEVIRVAIGDGRVKDGIACPDKGCEGSMQYSDVKTWARKEDFEAYDMLLLRLQLGDEEEFIRCLNVSCTAGQFHGGADDTPLITCHACGARQCHQHRSIWHEGYTCTQWDQEQRSLSNPNEASHEAIQAITKPCPGPGCGKRIHKVDGCDHMTCKPPGGCSWEFCWICFAPYGPIRQFNDSKHYDHCQHYRGVPNGNPAPSTADINAPSTISNALAGSSTGPPRRIRYEATTSDEGNDNDDEEDNDPVHMHPIGDDLNVEEAEQDEDGSSVVSSDNGEPRADEPVDDGEEEAQVNSE